MKKETNRCPCLVNMALSSSDLIVPKVGLRRWTLQAVDCYSRGCICKGCNIKVIELETVKFCKMKHHVIELVKRFGAPNVKRKNILDS